MNNKRHLITNKIIIVACMIGSMIMLTACGGKGKVDSGVAVRSKGGVIAGGPSGDAQGQDGKTKPGKDKEKDKDKDKEVKNICVLYTGGVAGAIDNAGTDSYYYDTERLTYSSVAGYRLELLSQNNAVLIVDAGDCMSGGKYANRDEGQSIVNIMNEVGYNVAIPGDRDFDYGMDRLMSISEQSKANYISCNLFKTEDGVGVFPSYCILESGGVKVAFVGVTSPSLVNDEQNLSPTFCNEDGDKIYDILYSAEGDKLYAAVQKAVNSAKSQADVVVVISHLGIDMEADETSRPDPLSSKALIMNTQGIDVLVDAGSELEVAEERVPNMAGGMVLLTSPGQKLSSFGEIRISKSGKIGTKLIKKYDYRAENVYELEIKCMGE